MSAEAPTWEQNAARWKEFYPSSDLQAEFFLLKFGKDGDVSRAAVLELCNQFKTFDKRKQGELEEDEAMMLLEARNSTKTFVELRAMVADIDLDKNRKLSFLEWACAIFQKSWMVLHAPSVDPREIAAAEALHAQAAAALEQAARDLAKFTEEAEYARLCADAADKNNKEAQERKRKFEEDREARRLAEEKKKREEEEEKIRLTSQAGVKGSAARFHYAAKETADLTMDNAARIKAEAAARKEAKRLAEEKAKAEAEAEVKAAEAARAAELQAKADAEAAKAAEEARIAEEAKRKAAEGSGTSEAERKAYEEQKAALEAEEAAKKAEEDRKRAEGRARLAARSNLWNKAEGTA